MNQVLKRLTQLQQQVITEKEFYLLLEKIQIRGILDYDKLGFIGYDYKNQKWLQLRNNAL